MSVDRLVRRSIVQMRAYISDRLVELPRLLLERTDVTWLWPDPDGEIPEADLYVWLYWPDRQIREKMLAQRSAQHLVLTAAEHVNSLKELQDTFCILVKPVAPFTFTAFLELALCRTVGNRELAEAEVLRMDRELLLTYVLEVNLKLQQYDRERNNFLARALHDFRSPLTAIYGFTTLLAEGRLGPLTDKQGETLERVRHSTARLTRLAASTLDLLGQGRTETRLRLQRSQFTAILEAALADVRPYLDEKEIEVKTNVLPPRGVLWVEPEQLQQVLVNLLENSCRYVPVRGKVEVTAYPWSRDEGDATQSEGKTGLRYRVDILDSGPGVPAGRAERIFEEYTSFSGPGDRSGVGLGLAICRSIVHAHGGSIWATPSDSGGMFSFVLPLPFDNCTEESGDDPT